MTSSGKQLKKDKISLRNQLYEIKNSYGELISMEPHSIHIVKVAWTHSASLLVGRAERFPSKLPGPRQRLHITAKPQLISNSAGVLPLILAAVQYQYVLTEKKTQLSREPIPCLKILQLQDMIS